MQENYKIFEDKTGITFDEWYKKMYKVYSRACYKMMLNQQHNIHDIVTEGMLLTLKYIYSFDQTKANINTYGWKIIKNKNYKNFLNTKKKNEFFFQDYDSDENNNNKYSFQIAYDSGDYEREYEEEIQNNYNIMISCISELPKKYAEIIIARELRGLDYQEIADEYNMGLSKVKNRIRVGRELLIKKYNQKSLFDSKI
jgi:RNA polymerase sigma factor (sigma-70 family)